MSLLGKLIKDTIARHHDKTPEQLGKLIDDLFPNLDSDGCPSCGSKQGDDNSCDDCGWEYPGA